MFFFTLILKQLIQFNYFENTTINSKYQCYKEKLQRKVSFDFSSNIEKLKAEEESIEKNVLLHLLQPTNINTSYVTMDEDFQILVQLWLIEVRLESHKWIFILHFYSDQNGVLMSADDV